MRALASATRAALRWPCTRSRCIATQVVAGRPVDLLATFSRRSWLCGEELSLPKERMLAPELQLPLPTIVLPALELPQPSALDVAVSALVEPSESARDPLLCVRRGLRKRGNTGRPKMGWESSKSSRKTANKGSLH
eukprot:SRR837773.25108.p2 GENE.SRR837773.25108~~SRR837773.25108.p2  ORF type:complete len:143 (+),score=22.27 SRR837773.25108:22-429(+)